MGVEIERKFLVNHTNWESLQKCEGSEIIQGFLINDKEKVIRVRTKGSQAYLTIKSCQSGLVRHEFEYEIPVDDARQLLRLFTNQQISKTRYKIKVGRHNWDVDVFHERNEGLVLAEIELSEEGEDFVVPDWVTKEVTHDERYYNANLVKFPYSEWGR